MKMYLAVLLMAVIAGCNKAKVETLYANARVAATHDVSCGLPLLDFSEDSARIRLFTGHADLSYTVINLPDSFNVQDKKLYVDVALLRPAEEFPCNTLGIGYPHVKIVAAKVRE